MKKSIFIICLVTAFFFTGINEIEAQWCFNVEYEDSECNCDTINSEKLSYYIYDLVADDYVVIPTTINLPSEPIILNGPEEIIWDAQDRYYVYARITYYDPTECCGGSDYDIVDGQDLIDCEVYLLIEMD